MLAFEKRGRLLPEPTGGSPAAGSDRSFRAWPWRVAKLYRCSMDRSATLSRLSSRSRYLRWAVARACP